MKNKAIYNSHSLLHNYCKQENYKGWDNFDGLNSIIFKNTPLYKSAIARLCWIQLFKRSPINLRKFTLVKKGYNAKGLALFVSGLVAIGKYDEAKPLINRLKEMTCQGYGNPCWGYNFDWQARMFLTSVGTPTIVTTVFVANALLDYFENTNDTDCLNMAIGACDFIIDKLTLFEDDDTLCFKYMPGSKGRVHNVNMMAACLLARVYQLNNNVIYYEKSKKAMTYAVKALKADYSWPYGEGAHQEFVDSFHTGFNLVSLYDWMKYTGENIWKDELSNAYQYYLTTFWIDSGCPKYYHNSLYPIDIHASAQGIVTCLKLSDIDPNSMEMADRIAEWAIKNMQNPKGYFYYQKTRLYLNRIPYIRWSQAWMFYALSLLTQSKDKKLKYYIAKKKEDQRFINYI